MFYLSMDVFSTSSFSRPSPVFTMIRLSHSITVSILMRVNFVFSKGSKLTAIVETKVNGS